MRRVKSKAHPKKKPVIPGLVRSCLLQIVVEHEDNQGRMTKRELSDALPVFEVDFDKTFRQWLTERGAPLRPLPKENE